MNKILTMEEAISRFVKDGDSVVLGAALEPLIPFAAGHEIIRQKKRNLTLVGPISDILFDQLVGAGCVSKMIMAWAGNVMMGVGYNLRRAVEKGIPRKVEIEDLTNFSVCLALHAGAMGIPFLPTKTLLGTDILRHNPRIEEMTCPYTGERLALVPALTPDVAIIHAQRADASGNTHLWGSTGVTKEACLASRRVIVSVEEVVDREVIVSDPNRTLIPGFLVSGLIHEPWGGHPSAAQGYYDRDHEHYGRYHEETKDETGFSRWQNQWVLSVKNRREYVGRLEESRLKKLRVRRSHLAGSVEYGF
jgi:glutaconate CoA-transferase subunit A